MDQLYAFGCCWTSQPLSTLLFKLNRVPISSQCWEENDSLLWSGGCTFQWAVLPFSGEHTFSSSYSTLETIDFSVGPLLCETLAILSGCLGLLCHMCRTCHFFSLNLVMSLLYYSSSLFRPLSLEALTFAFSLSPSYSHLKICQRYTR